MFSIITICYKFSHCDHLTFFFFFNSSNVAHRIYYWSQADSEEIRNIRSQALQ